jgi:hypothetical protein
MRISTKAALAAVGLVSMMSCATRSGSDSSTGAPAEPAPAGPADPGGSAGGPGASASGGPGGSSGGPVIGDGPPEVQLIGRFDETDPYGPWCGWPGCKMIANFRGSAVSVKLNEQAFPDGPSELDVAIDGVWKSPHLVLQQGEHVYDLADGLAPGNHSVELYKRTEGQTGVTQFEGYDFHGGTLLPPPPRRPHKMEILGDSDVTGFGYEGAARGGNCPGDAWAAKWENFRMAWGQRLADRLDAELNGTCFSGKGFYQNIWRPDTEIFSLLYPRSNPIDEHSVFDFTTFVPDVVVISLGGNDYNIGLPEDFGPPPFDGFVARVRELTNMVRKPYPNAHIFLMAYAVLTDSDPPGRNRRTNVETALKTVRDEHVAAGDARVYFTAPPQYTPDELIGCDGHGGNQYHERVAKFMEGEIRARTGW